MEKMKTAAWFLITAGVIVLIMYFETMWPYASVMILAGAALHTAVSLKTKKSLPLLCRAGYHRYKIAGYDEEIRSMRIYECTRCGKKHKTFLGGGGG